MSLFLIKPKYLQFMAVAYWYFMMIWSGGLFFIISIYLLIYSNYRYLVLLYYIWIYIDRHTKERGGRRIKWFYDSIIWKHFKDYFPHTLKSVDGVELDSNKNYLFCCFPHGILPLGTYASFVTNHLFPNHQTHFITIDINFYVPITRELMLAHRACSASKKSINHILTKEGGGNIAALIIGGATESEYSKPGQYYLNYKNRKGFIKLALQSGTALVPVFSFGEIDLFDQPEYSPFMRKIQAKVKDLFGFALIFPRGYGFLPYRKPVTTIVGVPMELPQIASPTIEDVDEVHAKFKQRLIELFEEYKYKYVVNPENTNLIFV